MPTVTLKNIPDELYARLKQAAAANRRSLNSEVLLAVERSLLVHKPKLADLLDQARALRQKTASRPATTRQLARAKAAGRP
jgi:plasmid stability protein